jgi:nitrogen fixation/metabolism regulation signal transduction histidine kinase
MKQFRTRFIIKMSVIIVLSITGGILLAYRNYWASIAVFSAGLILSVRAYLYATRAIADVKRLISAIRYSETNISFEKAIGKGLPGELAREMQTSINRFKEKVLQTESEYLFYDSLLQRIDSGIIVSDGNRNIKWINRAAMDIFGKPQPRELSDLKHVSPELPVILERLFPGEVALIKLEKENVENRYAVTATFFSGQGKDMKLITLKNIQPALESHESESWRKLIQVLTHEMMNSMAPVISLSETLSEVSENVDREQYLNMSRAMQAIHRRSRGLMDFVQNYRKLTQIPEPVPEDFPAKEILSDIDRLLKSNGIEFTYTVVPENMMLHADRAQMEQVLINLIKNAHEAQKDNEMSEITVSVYHNEYRKPVIEVVDKGYGIIPEVMDKVFVPFFTTKTGGSGIGLSICRQIMHLHRGNIHVRSEPDKGTKITLFFG